MNVKILAIGVVIIAIGLYYITTDYNSETLLDNDSESFLDIVDFDIVENQGYPLLLSVMVSQNIPENLDYSMFGYGFGWFAKKDNTLNGYTSNIHSDTSNVMWHNESITIQDNQRFCFDNAEVIIGNTKIEEEKLSIIVEQNTIENFDRVISFEILKDNSCHQGYAGKVIDVKMTN